MIDNNFGVNRYISCYANDSEELIDRIEILSFDISKMRKKYGMEDENDPMYDCYPIYNDDLSDLKSMISDTSSFNFSKYSYFFEASK